MKSSARVKAVNRQTSRLYVRTHAEYFNAASKEVSRKNTAEVSGGDNAGGAGEGEGGREGWGRGGDC